MSQAKWYEGQLWSGMTAGVWLGLLARNRFAISPRRLPLFLGCSSVSVINSVLALVQHLSYGRRISQIEVPDDPLFIIGHWRSGTTMLHEMLGLDPRNRCPTTYECLSPHHYLLTEKFSRQWLPFLMPRTRPMDNMKMSFGKPQEDEAALCCLGARSTFLTVAFPNRPLQDPRYAELAALTPGELARWQAIMQRFLQTLLYRQPGQLVLKSPQHTFRIPTLLQMFPRAKFVHIVRDPYVVFPSTVHFWTKMYERYALTPPPYREVEEMVLQTLVQMYDSYDQARPLIPDDRFCELKYEDLVADPVGKVAGIYQQLKLGDIEPARSAMELYAQKSKKYKTNEYEPNAERDAVVTERWKFFLERYGYPPR